MKNLIQNIVLSLLAFLIVTEVSAQYTTKKYLRANKNAEVVSYTDESTYSRGILVEKNRIFTANANGRIYLLDAVTRSSKKLFGLDEFKELRDLERSGEYYIAMKSGENGRLVRLNAQGNTEIIKYSEWDSTFFDGLDFVGKRGFIMGDPINGFFELYHSNDSGKTWERCAGKVKAFEGEAGFAGSGTNVQVLNDSTYIFVTGGVKSRFIKSSDNGNSWTEVLLPFYQEPSSGAFSVCFQNDSVGVVVGGDYLNPDLKLNTCYYTKDGGMTWFNSDHSPRGYRSCVKEFNSVFYACGSNGIDFSLDSGQNWIPFANGNFFALANTPTHLVATMKDGNVQLFDLIAPKK